MVIGQLDEFIHFLKFEKRYSQNTIDAYQRDLEQYQSYISTTFSNDNLLSATHFQVRSWLASLREANIGPRSINRKLSSLNAYYKYNIKKGKLDNNPLKKLHAQKVPERLASYLKENETQQLFEDIQFENSFKGATDRLICTLLYSCGLRRAELVNLKESDIEWSLKQIRVLGKGNKERLIPIGAELLELLKDYTDLKKTLANSNAIYLLTLDKGKQLYPEYVNNTVKKYLTYVTTLKKRSPHVLRHTFATHLLNNGANIQAIKDLLGHSSLAATQVYTHNNIAKLKEIHRNNHPRG